VLYEFKANVNDYLESISPEGARRPVLARSLGEWLIRRSTIAVRVVGREIHEHHARQSQPVIQ